MNSSILFSLAADLVLLLHVLLVVFIVFGLILTFTGHFLSWPWVRNPWFRLIHLIAICIVVVLSWLNLICPLTTIEMTLRSHAGDAVYAGSFISHWLEAILYYRAPAWVFVIVYTVFAALVVASWFLVRPRHFQHKDK